MLQFNLAFTLSWGWGFETWCMGMQSTVECQKPNLRNPNYAKIRTKWSPILGQFRFRIIRLFEKPSTFEFSKSELLLLSILYIYIFFLYIKRSRLVKKANQIPVRLTNRTSEIRTKSFGFRRELLSNKNRSQTSLVCPKSKLVRISALHCKWKITFVCECAVV